MFLCPWSRFHVWNNFYWRYAHLLYKLSNDNMLYCVFWWLLLRLFLLFNTWSRLRGSCSGMVLLRRLELVSYSWAAQLCSLVMRCGSGYTLKPGLAGKYLSKLKLMGRRWDFFLSGDYLYFWEPLVALPRSTSMGITHGKYLLSWG